MLCPSVRKVPEATLIVTVAGLLEPLARERSPFLAVPKADAAGTHWVEPVLVVDCDYLTLTTDGRLRQPSYRGLRADLTPADLL